MAHQFASWVQEILDSEQPVAYLLDGNLHITACNPGWDKFAAENGGVGISGPEVRGHFIFDFVPDVLVNFYQRKFSQAFRGGRWIGFDYHCSSPEVFRLFHMSLHPVNSAALLLVVNSYLADRRSPMPAYDMTVPESTYVSAEGAITMCAHCRRTRRVEQPRSWDWVPQFTRKSGRKMLHGLCPTCNGYFYPGLDRLPH